MAPRELAQESVGTRLVTNRIVEEFIRNGSKVVFCCRNTEEGKAFVCFGWSPYSLGEENE